MSGRNHPPTPRRLREARRRGEVPVSRVLTGLGSVAAGLLALSASLPGLGRDTAAWMRRALDGAVTGLDPLPADVALDALGRAARLGAAPALAACAGALLVGVIQTGGFLSPEVLRPRWERLDPAAGLRRVFSTEGLGRTAFTTVVACLALLLGAALLAGSAPRLARLPRLRPVGAWSAAAAIVGEGAAPLLALLAAAAGADLLLVRRSHLRALRMTRAEVERDLRQDEGDPRLRAERRRLHASLATGPASRPACLVVNPTHVAVALGWSGAADDPPVVLGKGTGRRAAALRREARRLGIPVVHDRALARALHRLADVGESIPEELYEATAAVLAWLDPGMEHRP